MKYLLLFYSLFFMGQAWALGSRSPGLDPGSTTDAMGGSAAALNQVTEESELDQGTEEQEREEIQEMESQENQEEELDQSRYDVPDADKDR